MLSVEELFAGKIDYYWTCMNIEYVTVRDIKVIHALG